MGIHEDVETILLGDPKDVDCVLDPFFIIYARTGGLERFPGEDVANGVVAGASYTGEVQVGILLGEGPGMELDGIAVEKVVGDMGGDIWMARELGVGSDIDAPQEDVSTVSVMELAILDSQAEGSHWGDIEGDRRRRSPSLDDSWCDVSLQGGTLSR